VNAIAAIRTEPGGAAWRQTVFYPFAAASAVARGGVVLRVELDAPRIETERYGSVPALEATAIWHDSDGTLAILAVNRHRSEALDLDVDVARLGDVACLDHTTLDGDPAATNTAGAPDTVRPRALAGAEVSGGHLRAQLPPLSWNVLRLGRSG
jgi:alpha-N-arabinofuranosidase